jgi:hypothetical protein
MLVTLVVLKELRFRDVSTEQPANILSMLVTFAVVKELRFSEVRDEQPLNIHFMLVTLVVVRFEMPVMVVSLEQYSNQKLHDVGLTFLNEELKTTLVKEPSTVSIHPGPCICVDVNAVPLQTLVTFCPLYVLPTLTGSS